MVKTVAVDFDGVIHAYGRGWVDGSIYDGPKVGAVDALRKLMQTYAVFVHTTREPEQVMPWLESLGFDVTIDERCGTCLASPDRRGACPDCLGSGVLTFWNEVGQILVTDRKLPAVAYIDDRAIRFTDWPQALADLDRFEGRAG